MSEERAWAEVEKLLQARKHPTRCRNYDQLLELAKREFGLGPGVATFQQVRKIVVEGGKEPPPRLCRVCRQPVQPAATGKYPKRCHGCIAKATEQQAEA